MISTNKFIGLLSWAVLLLAAPQAALAANWTPTGSLTTPRMYHTLTRLNDGRVLAAGGTSNGSNYLQSCELYDPATGNWTPAGPAGDLIRGRISHQAVLLPDGKVLVVGGIDTSGEVCQYAELYTPSPGGAGSWSDAGTLAEARVNHTLTLLASGKVLAAGGANGGGPLKSCELYEAGTWTTIGAGTLTEARQYHTATLLRDGRVLVEGGDDIDGAPLSSAELYNPLTQTWTPATPAYTPHGNEHMAVLMPDGFSVLVTGGFETTSQVTGDSEYFDYYDTSDSWYPAAPLNKARAYHASALLANGKVLVAGGWGGATAGNLTSVELYNPMDETWSFTDSLNTARIHFTAVLLANGKVLVAGGDNGSGGPLQTAEIYSPRYLWHPAGLPAYFAGTGHWYRAFTFSPAELEMGFNSWEYAKVQAEAMGGYLATVTSEAENDFVFNLIKQDKLWYQKDPPDQYAQGPWIGGYQDYRLDANLVVGPDDPSTYYVWKSNEQHVYSDEAWKWVTGETWSYTKWAEWEPNDYPNDEWIQIPGTTPPRYHCYERGHQNYLHYFNNQYQLTIPTVWSPFWEDATVDGFYYNLGFVVEWNQKPPPLPLASNPAPTYLLLLE